MKLFYDLYDLKLETNYISGNLFDKELSMCRYSISENSSKDYFQLSGVKIYLEEKLSGKLSFKEFGKGKTTTLGYNC